MKTQLLTIFGSAFSLFAAQAQVPEGAGPNLIPNPGFEEVQGKRPSDDIDGSAAFRYNMVNWMSPTKSTPDLRIVTPQEIATANKNGVKIDAPRTGYKMVAILTHNPGSERTDTYREYIQVKLAEPTKKDAEYYYEFWVCKAVRAKYISNNLGVVLSAAQVTNEESWEPLTDMKPDANYTEIINKDGRKWQRISGTIKSYIRSQYFIIGNFFGNDKTTLVDAKDGGDFENAYYFIDDVALHEINIKPEPVFVPEPEPEPVVIVPEEELEVGKMIELDHVYFETAKWDLLPASFEQLDQVVALLEKYPGMEIEIHGHTDSRGSDEDNQKLSENRTKSVYEYLTKEKGIDASRMAFVGYGEEKPRDDNDTSEGRQRNRRVEFVITKVGEKNVDVKYKDEVKPYTDKQ